MDAAFQWGIDIINAVQQLDGLLWTELFRTLTFIGNQEFYLLLIPLLYWCVDRTTGVRVALIYLLAIAFHTILRDLIAEPRPYLLEPGILRVDPASVYGEGGGMPSGHAMVTLAVWAVLAARARRWWFWLLAVVVTFLVGLSRIYLGVHLPTQVIAGWALGIGVFFLFMLLVEPLTVTTVNRPVESQLFVAAVVPLLIMATHPVADVIAAMAVLFGMGTGLALAARYVPFSVQGTWTQRMIRYGVGILVVFVLYIGLKMVFPGEGSDLYEPFRFARYALVGAWVTFGAPWLFTRTQLVLPRPSPVA